MRDTIFVSLHLSIMHIYIWITLANDCDDLYDADREALAGPPSPDHGAQSRILRLASICLALINGQWLLITGYLEYKNGY